MTSTESPGREAAFTKGANLLLMAACIVILIAGLREAASLLIPMLLAGFLTLVCLPPMTLLRSWGLPSGVAITMVILVAAAIVFGAIALVSGSLDTFVARAPEYAASVRGQIDDWIKGLERLGVSAEKLQMARDEISKALDLEGLLGLIAGSLQEMIGALSNLFVILLTVVFMLFESTGFAQKVSKAFPDPEHLLEDAALLRRRVSGYVTIKAGVSLLTGVLVIGLTMVLGVDFPVLWGFVAFVFNFVPNVGSILAAIPAIVVALINPGPGTALAVAIGYVVINLVVGNMIEPRVMGRKLGLSTLVVFLSLIFWSWLWGPIGMLLSVPLTVVAKIALEHVEEFRPIAVMLGPVDDSSRESCLVD